MVQIGDRRGRLSPGEPMRRIDTMKAFMTIGTNVCQFPRAAYNPCDLTDEQQKNAYRTLGETIQQRFSNPIKQVSNKKGTLFTIAFDKPTAVNHIVIEEDYRYGHRIRKYTLHGKINNKWEIITQGLSVGRKKIDAFATQNVTELKLKINAHVNMPLIRSLKVFDVKNYSHNPAPTETNEWRICGNWDTKTFKNNKDTITLDLSKYITTPGQYEVKFLADVAVTGTSIDSAIINFENQNTMQLYLTKKDHQTFYINRTSQISINSSSTLTLFMRSDNNVFQNRGVFKIRKRP